MREGDRTHRLPAVLVVDDDSAFLADIQTGLGDFCRSLYCARTPLDALWLIERETIDMAICDLVLVGTDGRHILEHLRIRWPRIARVLVTGYGDQVIQGEPLAAAQAILLKPFDVWQLVGLFSNLFPNELSPHAPPQRAHTRQEVRLDARLIVADRVLQRVITNLSLAGAQVEHDEVLAPGTHVRLSFRLPSEDADIDARAVVRWSTGRAVGLQLEGLRARDVWTIHRYSYLVRGPLGG